MPLHMLSPRLQAAYVMARAGLSTIASEHDRLALAERMLEAVNDVGLQVAEKPTRTPQPEPAQIPPIWPGNPVTLAQLIPGRLVQRYTEEAGEEVRTDVPCCERRITVEARDGLETDLVCPFDGLRYTLVLVDDEDGGLWANFTVVGEVVMPRRRSPTRRR
ncbi:hypothetical protein HII36_05755 [Nonomuraea sp. NN258]|uniref:hypothetical protein n=1 Tax=Nonomuraea antri TaxID=2730852 RepID=UPI001567E802|nr:hypothetical protein [Nonomuraea antri]NRQ31344.1 hypothetical protein [Nonomuraea antri]